MSVERQEALDRRSLVEPEVDDERLDANWSAIEGRLDRAPRRRLHWQVGGVAVAAAAAVLLWFALPKSSPWVGTTLATSDESAEVQLPEGSTVAAEAETELVRMQESEREVRLALRRGAASFDVVRNPDRLFAIEAGDVQVRVVGTAFRVARANGKVRVSVTRGAVDVRRGEELVRLRAGEAWEGDAELADEAPAPTAEAQPVPIETEPVEATAPSATAPSADELFAAAADARRSGDAQEAARLYGRLAARFPRDSRSALASFEVGRIRLDQLDDPRGAATAFRRALALGGGPFAQDARARLVEAYDAAGLNAACERSKAAYLERHPNGRHVVDVTRACE